MNTALLHRLVDFMKYDSGYIGHIYATENGISNRDVLYSDEFLYRVYNEELKPLIKVNDKLEDYLSILKKFNILSKDFVCSSIILRFVSRGCNKEEDIEASKKVAEKTYNIILSYLDKCFKKEVTVEFVKGLYHE